jgi:two-component system nitrogen regulation sensor histidine kinase NtrY
MVQDLAISQAELHQSNLKLGRQNAELDRHGRYVEAILDNIAAGVVSLDGTGRISTLNKAAVEILGLGGLNLIGQNPMTLLHGEFGDLMRDLMTHMAQGPGARWERQMVLRSGGQERKLLVNVVGLAASEGERAGLVAVFEDVTELERMQRTEAWREVARRIAHEIKNPLTPIKLSAQRLERKFAGVVGDPVFVQCTELIVRQVEHLQQMVKEFSAFAKLPEVRPRKDHLAPLLEEVVALFQNSHSTIAWDLRIEGTIPEMRIDPEAIRRAFMNVLTNAAEALEGMEGGRVDVAAAHDERTGQVRVRIADNGPGLAEEDRSRLFEPYYTRKKSGTGLGLTIVRSIVADHHGYVRAESAEDGGLVMTIELPVSS